MKNKWHQFKAGLRYFLFAKHRRGYGIHSPFLYDFVRNVFLNSTRKNIDGAIKDEFRRIAAENRGKVMNNGLGAGTNKILTSSSLLKLSRTSSTPDKYLSLMNQIIKHCDIKSFLELGACCGITSAALAKSNPRMDITTIEGSKERYQVANQLFLQLQLSNIRAIHGEFQSELRQLLENDLKFDLIFIDGDHTYEATIKNYNEVVSLLKPNGIIVLDDIYWSEGMTKAWREIQNLDSAVLTIDLYRLGIVFPYRKQAKQHFIIRY